MLELARASTSLLIDIWNLLWVVARSRRNAPQARPRLASRHLEDRKSTRLNSSHLVISYAVFCLKKKNDSHPGNALHPGIRSAPRLVWTPSETRHGVRPPVTLSPIRGTDPRCVRVKCASSACVCR